MGEGPHVLLPVMSGNSTSFIFKIDPHDARPVSGDLEGTRALNFPSQAQSIREGGLMKVRIINKGRRC